MTLSASAAGIRTALAKNGSRLAEREQLPQRRVSLCTSDQHSQPEEWVAEICALSPLAVSALTLRRPHFRSSRDDRIGSDPSREPGSRPVAAGSSRGEEPTMKRIRQMRRRGIVRFALAIGSIAVVAAMAAHSPPSSGDPGKEEAKATGPAVTVSTAAPAADNPQASDLVVHEWGTFLGMNGSDGTALDGMYHEEHALPAFVHSRAPRSASAADHAAQGRDAGHLLLHADGRSSVRVGVGFPQGVWTQWYPQAALVNPSLARAGRDSPTA